MLQPGQRSSMHVEAVVPDSSGRYVRDAVTLQRLEYCVLSSEGGQKKYVRGEAVVFPEPNQKFVDRAGQRKFRALELSEITGLYVKVIAAYEDEDGVRHSEGEELFITGRNRIYFPREEHVIVRYGDQELHRAVAVPKGQGRYTLNRLTGEIRLHVGPSMLLPDPRFEVLTQRVLSDRECRLLYPASANALAVNRALRRGESVESALATGHEPARDREENDGALQADEDFVRPSGFVPPRTVTLDGDYRGAVGIDVWSGYAIQVVDKSGERRVVRGPATVLLQYDETVEALSLSTGVPKSRRNPLQTAYLRVAGNKVSDALLLTSSDLVQGRLTVSYRVSFEGDAEAAWFAVDDYVKLLCDHTRSILKAMSRKLPVRALRQGITTLVRDAILGTRPDDQPRKGLAFADNGMRIHDVDVLDLEILDEDVDELLVESQSRTIRGALDVAAKEAALVDQRRLQEIERALRHEAQSTELVELELRAEVEQRAHALDAQRSERKANMEALAQALELGRAEAASKIRQSELALQRIEHESELERRRGQQALALEELEARVTGAVRQAGAFAPELISAVNRLGDAQLLSSLTANFGELAAVEGRGLLETARKFLDFVPATLLPSLPARAVSVPEDDV